MEGLNTFKEIKHTEYFKIIRSTNDYLLKKAKNHSLQKGHLVLADEQTHGRGRLGHRWYSPAGGNLYLSLSWGFDSALESNGCLAPSVAVAIVQALKKLLLRYEIKAQYETLNVKWPNDVSVRSLKLAGVLIESVHKHASSIANDTNYNHLFIIGIGLNLNMPLNSALKPYTDLNQWLGVNVDRQYVLNLLIESLLHTLYELEHQGFSSLQQKWIQLNRHQNQCIQLKTAEGYLTGINRGIDSLGRLLIEPPEGPIVAVSSGEIIEEFHSPGAHC